MRVDIGRGEWLNWRGGILNRKSGNRSKIMNESEKVYALSEMFQTLWDKLTVFYLRLRMVSVDNFCQISSVTALL